MLESGSSVLLASSEWVQRPGMLQTPQNAQGAQCSLPATAPTPKNYSLQNTYIAEIEKSRSRELKFSNFSASQSPGGLMEP